MFQLRSEEFHPCYSFIIEVKCILASAVFQVGFPICIILFGVEDKE